MCATGLVGTILYAPAFHGQETGYAAGLAKLGLTSEGQRADQRAVVAATPVPAHAPQLTSALALNRQVVAILQTIFAEFDEQSLFVRPIAKRMFQQGTGMSAGEWLGRAQVMTTCLEHVADGTTPLASSGLADYRAELDRLANYLRKQQGDARGWIKDPEKLRAALEALAARETTVRQLATMLSQIGA